MRLKNNKLVNSPIIIDSKPIDDKATHDFLSDLVKRGVLEIKPSFEKSRIRYPDAEEYFKSSSFTTMKYSLDLLVREGILKEKAVDRVLTCPNCNSPEVHAKFACPKCGSDNVGLTQFLEHKICGYIGSRNDFLKVNSLVCPRCGTALSEADGSYRGIGNFYECEKCDNRFDKPEVIHICQNCGKTSTFQDIKYTKISTYRINDDVLRELTSELPLLENMRKFLENEGFKVKLHSKITGVSGIQSSFDLIVQKESILLVIDVSLEGNKCDIISFLAKQIDINPTKALILDLSGGTELAALGKIYGLEVKAVDKVSQEVPADFATLISNLQEKKIKDSGGKQI